MTTIADHLQTVRQRIASACVASGRDPSSVGLLAVSKAQDAAALAQAFAAGQCHFGENYVAEALVKIETLADRRSELVWHFIGPLQANKTRAVAEHFDWVHSVDRLRVAQRLSEQRPDHLPPLQICLQVNISAEDSKSGVAPADTLALARAVSALPRLRLRGLMAIPAPAEGEAAQRRPLASLRALRDDLQDQLGAEGLALDTLSMGMSADLEAAVAEGATWLRIGTAIFGSRPTRP
jgi:pyridoxal phosphate enzyme (YggS family)